MSRAAAAALLVSAAATAALILILVSRGPAVEPDRLPPPLPPAPAPAFQIPTPRPLDEPIPAARWAPVLQSVPARLEPSTGSPVAALLESQTPEGTANIVLVRQRAVDDTGMLWIKVTIPGLPGETDGWVPRPALGTYHAVRTRLLIDLDRLSATLLRDGQAVFRSKIGVGTAVSPTPRGSYYVRSRLTKYANPFYGPLAFGTSVRSPSVTDWPDGGFVGLHGTNQPELLPGRVSHGCIRFRNGDILRLGRLMPIGTPISIQ
ncbi:MAG: L,D-transpeptidase [Gaiella sp.]